MLYKGIEVLCDSDDLVIIGDEGNYKIGYWGAGGVFVTIETKETEDEANVSYKEILWGILDSIFP